MTKQILDSLNVDGNVSANNFIGSGAQLTDIPQHATLTGFNATVGGDIISTDTVQSGMEKLEYKVNNIEVPDQTYTNFTPVPSGLGGIPAGETFNNKPITDVITELLYPYQVPSFSSFSISGQATTLEVGATTSNNPTFTWAISNSSNVNTSSLCITDTTANEQLAVNVSIISPLYVSHSGVTKSAVGSEVYTISATNNKSVIFNKTFTINWRFALYYGESVNSSPTESLVEGLRIKTLASTYAATYNFYSLINGYKWICYPSSFGQATIFKDTATNLGVPFEPPLVLLITNSFGVSTNYNCHRSTNALGGAISIMVS